MIMQIQKEDVLILTKTYPQPSTKYRETTCVAAITRAGVFRRLFPVPYRLLDGEKKFNKWEWVRVRLSKASNDHRPESYRLDVDSIERIGKISTKHAWAERMQWIERHIVGDFTAIEQRRQETHQTLAIIRPKQLLELSITPVRNPEWTDEEKISLLREGLFDDDESRSRPPLRKLPFSFYYCYECATSNGIQQHRHMITDWEVGALYWHCQHNHGPLWEKPFRQKLEEEFCQKDLLFLMGTIHRFPDQWLIIGLIYPPKLPAVQMQLQLDS